MTEEVAELPGEPLPEETGEVEETEESTTSEPEDTSAEPEKPKAKGVQKRIDELTSNWRTAERDRDYWRDLALKESPKQEDPKPSAPQGKPDVNQFDSYDSYLDALADWKVDQRLTEREQAQRQEQEQQTRSQREYEFRAKEMTFSESHPDYNSVVLNPALPITEDMFNAALSSEKGPELLYHLGTNPQEAARLAAMNPVQQAMELGRIEASMSRPARNQTSAPDPVTPINGGGNQVKGLEDMTADEYRAFRDKQEADRRAKR